MDLLLFPVLQDSVRVKLTGIVHLLNVRCWSWSLFGVRYKVLKIQIQSTMESTNSYSPQRPNRGQGCFR